MTTPILYIGIGTSGLRMLREAQKLFYSTTGTNCPNHVRFLAIETDTGASASFIPGSPQSHRSIEIFPANVNPQADIETLRNRIRCRVQTVSSIPAEAVPLLQVQDHQVEWGEFDLTRFSKETLFRFPHILDLNTGELMDQTRTILFEWVRMIDEEQWFLAIDLGQEVPVIFVPNGTPEKYLKRIEVLFNDIELTTNLEKDEKGNEIERVHWLPPYEQLAFADMGAGGMRSFGRISLWGSTSQGSGNNLQNLRSKIRTLYQSLLDPETPKPPTVFIAGTFAGGTNSGMFLDVAYLSRDAIDPSHHQNPSIEGLFLLPQISSDDVKSNSNAFASLRDLAHFTTYDAQFLARWPLDVSPDAFPEGTSPFDLATLMSLSWMPDGNLENLYRVSGMFLYLMGSGFLAYRKARLVDLPSFESGPLRFSAIGLSSLSYPKGEIRLGAACNLAREYLIEAWGNETMLYDPAELRSTPVRARFDQRRETIRDVLNSAFNEALAVFRHKGPNGERVTATLERFLQRVQNKECYFNREHLIRLFGSGSDLFQAANCFAPEAGAAMHRMVDSLLINELEESENLEYLRLCIDEVLRFLKGTMSVVSRSQTDDWEAALEGDPDSISPDGLVSQMLRDDKGLFARRKALRMKRLSDTAREMHRSVLTRELKEIIDYIETGRPGRSCRVSRFKESIPRESAPTVCIPKLKELNSLLSDTLLGIKELKEYATREVAGASELMSRVFPSGSFESEVDAVVKEFKQQVERQIEIAGNSGSSRFLTVINAPPGQSLWSSIMEIFSEPNHMVERITEATGQSLERLGLPAPAAKELYSSAKLPRLAETAMSNISIPHSPIEPENLPTHPKVVITSQKSHQEEVENSLGALKNFQTRMDAISPLAEDMVVFFDERPVDDMEKLLHLHLWKPYYNQRTMMDRSLDCYIHT